LKTFTFDPASITSVNPLEDFKLYRLNSVRLIWLSYGYQINGLAYKLQVEANISACNYTDLDQLHSPADRIVVSWKSNLLGIDQSPIRRYGVLCKGAVVVPDVILATECRRFRPENLIECLSHYIQKPSYNIKSHKVY